MDKDDLKKVGKAAPELTLEKVGLKPRVVAVDEDLEKENTLEVQAFRKVLLYGGEFRGARGVRGPVGETGATGRRGRRGLRGETGERGEAGAAGESIVGPIGLPGVEGTNGVDGANGRAGETGRPGPQGVPGAIGPAPRHKWEGTKLSFEQPGGTFGRAVNLQGPAGSRGVSGNSAKETWQDIRLDGTNLIFEKLTAGPLGKSTVVDMSGLSGGGGGFAGLGLWRYRTDLTPNPGAGRLQFDTPLIDNATELYVNEVNDGGTDMTVFLDKLVAGDIVYLQIQTDASQFVIIEIGTPTKAAGVYTFPIAAIEGQGTTPTNNSSVAFVLAGNANPAVVSKDVTIQNPIPTDVIRYFYTQNQITVSKLVYVLQGVVGADATAFISFGPDRSVLGTDLINAGTVVSNQTVGQVITVFDNAVIPAFSHIAIRINAITNSPTEIAATLFYI